MVQGRDEMRAQAVCRELGDRSTYVIADLAASASAEMIVRETVHSFGRIDVLVNNAAVTTRSNLETTDSAMFDRIIAINLRAPMLLIRAAVNDFDLHGGGTVVNIGSVNALAGEPNLLAYSASKGGLQTLTRNLANALATRKIRVNQLNVGWVTSPNEVALKQREGMKPGWETRVPSEYAPFGRLLTPEQVAEHIVFWASDDSYPANGCIYELEQYSNIGRNVSKSFE